MKLSDERELQRWVKRIQDKKVIIILGNSLGVVELNNSNKLTTITEHLQEETDDTIVIHDSLPNLFPREFRQINDSILFLGTAYVELKKRIKSAKYYDQLAKVECIHMYINLSIEPYFKDTLKKKRNIQSLQEWNLFYSSKNELNKRINFNDSVYNIIHSFGVLSEIDNENTDDKVATNDFARADLIMKLLQASEVEKDKSELDSLKNSLVRAITENDLIFLGCAESHWFIIMSILQLDKNRKSRKLFVDNKPFSNESRQILREWRCDFWESTGDAIDEFLSYLKNYVSCKTQFDSFKGSKIFLSYSSKDTPDEQITAINGILHDLGFVVWVDFQNLIADCNLRNENHHEVIETILSESDIFVPLITNQLIDRCNSQDELPYSLHTEWSFVISQQVAYNSKVKIAPICLENTRLQQLTLLYDKVFEKGRFSELYIFRNNVHRKNWGRNNWIESYEPQKEGLMEFMVRQLEFGLGLRQITK